MRHAITRRRTSYSIVIRKSTKIVAGLILIIALFQIPKPNIGSLGIWINTKLCKAVDISTVDSVIAIVRVAEERKSDTALNKISKMLCGFDIGKPETVMAFSTHLHNGVIPVSSAVINEDAAEENRTHTEIKTEEKTIIQTGGIAINNHTGYPYNIEELLAQKPNLKLGENKKPQILIVHTHTTESFIEDRTLDMNKNVSKVGGVITDVLTQNGFHVIHDKTVHDYPSYNGSYKNALETIMKNIEKNKSIQIVLDIHRDAIVKEDGTKLKLCSDIDGKKVGQIMFVVGTNEGGLTHDNWLDNLRLAVYLQNGLNEMYPTLARPIDLRKERFNQHATKGSLIIEVGTTGNTLEEAEEGARLLAKSLAKSLKEL